MAVLLALWHQGWDLSEHRPWRTDTARRSPARGWTGHLSHAMQWVSLVLVCSLSLKRVVGFWETIVLPISDHSM